MLSLLIYALFRLDIKNSIIRYPSDFDMSGHDYSPRREAKRIFDYLCGLQNELSLPSNLQELAKNVEFTSDKDAVYLPIPFKETETGAALKGVEALVASSLASLKYGEKNRKITIDLELATCFLFQTYLSTIDGLGKYDAGVKAKLKGKWLVHVLVNFSLTNLSARHRSSKGAV